MFSINLIIVECKAENPSETLSKPYSINLIIVECKVKSASVADSRRFVLI